MFQRRHARKFTVNITAEILIEIGGNKDGLKRRLFETCREVEAIFNFIEEFGQKQYEIITNLGRSKSCAKKTI